MKYAPLVRDELFRAIEPLVRGAGSGVTRENAALALLDLKVSRHRGSVQAALAVYRPGKTGRDAVVSIEDCQAVSRAVMARLELELGTEEGGLTLEVSSPGIERKITNTAEFPLFLGRGVRVYRTDISDWSSGILKSADETTLHLERKGVVMEISMEVIAKAQLDYAAEAAS